MDRTITHADVAAASVLGVHLTNVKGGKVHRMNDGEARDVQLATGWAHVNQHHRSGSIGAIFRRAKPRVDGCSGNNTDPRLVT